MFTLHRRALAALALAALLATAGCAGFVGTTDGAPEARNLGAQQDEDPARTDVAGSATGKTISVNADGSVTADPDKAVLRVAVQATADSASEARQRLAENVTSLREALVDAGVPEDNVTTEYYNIRQVNERRPVPTESTEPDESTRYRATHALSIEIADVDRVGEIIGVAVDNGATDVQHVEFTLSDATRDDLRDRALRQAMANALEDAEVVASAADLEVVGVQSASTGGTHVRPYRAEMTAADAGGASTSIDSGPVTVTAQVQVTYEATNATE